MNIDLDAIIKEKVFGNNIEKLPDSLHISALKDCMIEAIQQALIPYQWIDVKEDTKHDGVYLAIVEETEECNAVHQRHRIIENRKNKWVLADNQKLLKWMPLPKPPQQ